MVYFATRTVFKATSPVVSAGVCCQNLCIGCQRCACRQWRWADAVDANLLLQRNCFAVNIRKHFFLIVVNLVVQETQIVAYFLCIQCRFFVQLCKNDGQLHDCSRLHSQSTIWSTVQTFSS